MDNKTKKKNITTILLSIMIVGLLGGFYLYKSNSDGIASQLKADKDLMLSNLNKSKDSLSVVINENSSIKEELLVEQQKITNLIEDLKNSNETIEELNKFKIEVVKLRKQVAVLKNDKMELVKKYEALKNTQDSTVSVLNSTIESKEKIEASNIDLNRMVKKSARVTFAALKTEVLNKSKSGSATITENASKANYFRIKFMIIGNKLTSAVDKVYYVQIIDPKNNIMGNKLSKKFGPMILDYSYADTFKYVDANLDVTSGIALDKLEKGNYYVNVFDNEKLVLKSNFILR